MKRITIETEDGVRVWEANDRYAVELVEKVVGDSWQIAGAIREVTPTEATHVRVRAAALVWPNGDYAIFGNSGCNDRDCLTALYEQNETDCTQQECFITAPVLLPTDPPTVEGEVST
ncbi:MAG: hypothetical protein AAF432_00620 [Planctomycetota bacterium]